MARSFSGHFDFSPISEQTRGIAFSDNGHNKVLVKESCHKTLSCLFEMLGAESLQGDIYNTRIENSGNLLLGYRFKGHQWTVLEVPDFQPVKKKPVLKSHVANILSQSLFTETIFYNQQPYEERFDIYQNGELIEKFSSFPRGEIEYQRQTNNIIDNELHWFQDIGRYIYFLPTLTQDEIKDIQSSPGYRTPYDMGACLILRHDLYIPSIRWEPLFQEKEVFFAIENLSLEDFEEFEILRLDTQLM